MCALKVSELAKDLRSLADLVERRLWVASPYIGSWKAVRKILGSVWQKVDVRLLTDKDSGILAQDTIEQFAAHRPVRSLEGLHAKLYIVDDSVLLTSANLTEAAFTRRYEVGLVLKGQQARGLLLLGELLLLRGDGSLFAWRHRARAVLQAALQEVVYRLDRNEVAFPDFRAREISEPDPAAHRVERDVQLLRCLLLCNPILGGHDGPV
jgi:phosphatidylserine/phosphatidylglycerophosphate/cardiolipin synthase-like enzyme